MERMKRWAGSRRGVCSLGLTAVVLVIAVRQGAVSAVQVPVVAVLILAGAAALVVVLASLWEDKMLPTTPRFARAQQPSGSRQLREDGNARVFTDRSGFLFARRCFFVGTGCPPTLLALEFVAEARALQGQTPVLLVTTPARRFWWYRDGFAWENQGLEARDVMALLHAKDRRHNRQMETAHLLLDVEQGRAVAVPRQRRPLPREVQREVFTRDGGRCVECQSDFQIQYDHVIPHSLGGADTVQNLQLLCAPCNQSKGATL